MKRRQFITLIGGAAAWPLKARAQQPSMPTIGYLSPRSPDVEAQLVAAFRRGLSETGYIEGRNVAIEYRWAEGRYDRLPILAKMLVARATVMVTTGGPTPARAVLAATSTTPVVFWSGSDPIEDGLVKRFERPDGNATGFHVFTTSLGPKRLGLLRELVPNAREIAFLVNPSNPPEDARTGGRTRQAGKPRCGDAQATHRRGNWWRRGMAFRTQKPPYHSPSVRALRLRRGPKSGS